MKSIYKISIMSVIGIFGAFLMSLKKDSFEVKPPKTAIYEIMINSIDGVPLNLNELKGKKVLFVNVASKCGYTSQYEGLQKLHEVYGDKVTIIGLPCNQFMGQEPGTHQEIVSFCKKNYGVTFQLTEKVNVKGAKQHLLYKWLTSKDMNGSKDSKVKWNFQKYLINESGELVKIFAPSVKPMDSEITDLLQ